MSRKRRKRPSDEPQTLPGRQRLILPKRTNAAEPQDFDVVEGSRYLTKHQLGRGGMGVVYEVEDRLLRRTFAEKKLLSRDPRSLEQFIEEACIQAELEHPGILPVYHLNVDDPRNPEFGMQVVKGNDLGNLLRGEYDSRELLRHMLRVCDTLDFMHSRGYVHRDLKPENIMIGEFGRVYVMDMGIVRKIGTIDPRDTAGTPAYMAPEQASDPTMVDERTDVYALGAILYRMLTGELVREHVPMGRDRNSVEARRRIIKGNKITPPREMNPDIPPELEAIIVKALSTSQRYRYQSAGEVRDDLEAYLEGREVGAHAYTWWERTSRRLQRHVGKIVAGAAAMIMAVSVSGVMYGLAERALKAEARKDAAIARADEESASRRVAEYAQQVEVQRREAAELLAGREEVLKRKFKYSTDGRTLIDERDYDAALKLYGEAIDEFSEESEFYVRRAECYHAERKFGRSIADCERAIELDPGNHAAYRRLGIVYAAMGKISDAGGTEEIDTADESLHKAIELGSVESMYDRAKMWHLVAVQRRSAEMAQFAMELYDDYAKTQYAQSRSQDIARSKAELRTLLD